MGKLVMQIWQGSEEDLGGGSVSTGVKNLHNAFRNHSKTQTTETQTLSAKHYLLMRFPSDSALFFLSFLKLAK